MSFSLSAARALLIDESVERAGCLLHVGIVGAFRRLHDLAAPHEVAVFVAPLAALEQIAPVAPVIVVVVAGPRMPWEQRLPDALAENSAVYQARILRGDADIAPLFGREQRGANVALVGVDDKLGLGGPRGLVPYCDGGQLLAVGELGLATLAAATALLPRSAKDPLRDMARFLG
jgi:hypothetical protein